MWAAAADSPSPEQGHVAWERRLSSAVCQGEGGAGRSNLVKEALDAAAVAASPLVSAGPHVAFCSEYCSQRDVA